MHTERNPGQSSLSQWDSGETKQKPREAVGQTDIGHQAEGGVRFCPVWKRESGWLNPHNPRPEAL